MKERSETWLDKAQAEKKRDQAVKDRKAAEDKLDITERELESAQEELQGKNAQLQQMAEELKKAQTGKAAYEQAFRNLINGQPGRVRVGIKYIESMFNDLQKNLGK